MSVVSLHPVRAEVWCGVEAGEDRPTWFVSVVDDIARCELIVSDRLSEVAAIDDAEGWALPVVVRRL